jgi:hypothetical protein
MWELIASRESRPSHSISENGRRCATLLGRIVKVEISSTPRSTGRAGCGIVAAVFGTPKGKRLGVLIANIGGRFWRQTVPILAQTFPLRAQHRSFVQCCPQVVKLFWRLHPCLSVAPSGPSTGRATKHQRQPSPPSVNRAISAGGMARGLQVRGIMLLCGRRTARKHHTLPFSGCTAGFLRAFRWELC